MTLNYLNVGGPGNVPPTAAQALNVNTVNVSLSPTNSGDTSQVITHNLNFSAAHITHGFPQVFIQPLDVLAQASAWYALSQAPNFTILARGGTTAGVDTANAQVIVSIATPNSIVR